MKSYTFMMKATLSFDAGDEVIMGIAGRVSRAMLSRYSHVLAAPRAVGRVRGAMCAT